MNDTNNSGSGEDARNFSTEEQSLDDLISKAVGAAAKGENVDQLLEVMLASLPNNAREKVRKQFGAALAKRGLKGLSGETADIPSRATLSRMRNALALTTRQMMERIKQLVRARPDLAKTIQQAGQALVQSGVLADKVVSMSETELGTTSPSATVAKPQQDRGTGRSA